jgi:hypothetical protein
VRAYFYTSAPTEVVLIEFLKQLLELLKKPANAYKEVEEEREQATILMNLWEQYVFRLVPDHSWQTRGPAGAS